MPEVPVIGQPGATNNPLVVLNTHLGEISKQLERIAGTVSLPHRYALAEANDPGGHGKVWGSFCMACSDAVAEFTYPCRKPELEMIDTARPPAFFTIGDVFEIDPLGRMVRYIPPV
jgi:hypothetical protein